MWFNNRSNALCALFMNLMMGSWIGSQRCSRSIIFCGLELFVWTVKICVFVKLLVRGAITTSYILSVWSALVLWTIDWMIVCLVHCVHEFDLLGFININEMFKGVIEASDAWTTTKTIELLCVIGSIKLPYSFLDDLLLWMVYAWLGCLL